MTETRVQLNRIVVGIIEIVDDDDDVHKDSFLADFTSIKIQCVTLIICVCVN